MTDIPAFAPGCFGSALAFDGSHPICGSCTFAQQCRPLHEANLAALRAAVGCSDPLKRIGVINKEETVVPATGTVLTKKVEALNKRIEGLNLNIVANLRSGVNPFANAGPKFMKIAAHILIGLGKANKTLTQPVLAELFVRHAKWAHGTADAHARQALQVLVHVGAIENVDGGYRIRSH